LTSAGGKFLVQDSSNNIYLSDSGCSTTGVLVDTGITSFNDAKMVKVGNDFYIAVRAGSFLKYYKVSGSTATATPLNTAISLSSGINKYHYALDGNGRLYAIAGGTAVVIGYKIDGTLVGPTTAAEFTGLFGLADRSLAKKGSNAYEITITGSGVNSDDKGTTLFNAVDSCTDISSTKSVDGEGTNFIKCAHTSGLYGLTFDSVSNSYLYVVNSIGVSNANDVKWATNKALVKSGSTVYLCNTTPTISCSPTDLPNINIDINNYKKVNGDNVFYNSGGALKVGNVFDPPGLMLITASSPSGGNVSFDLTKFASTVGAPCATQIAYLSSSTAIPTFYTIAQPSSACVDKILKVY
jgi:hypothetical protein